MKYRPRASALLFEALETRRLLASYLATFEPLNNSGVSGTAELTLEGNQLTITISAQGLEPNQVHPMHIHGRFEDPNPGDPGPPAPRDSAVPTLADDVDGDGFIEATESVASAGLIILPLSSPPGDRSAEDPRSTLTYPRCASGKKRIRSSRPAKRRTMSIEPSVDPSSRMMNSKSR